MWGYFIFSSPEPKAQVSFSYHNWSVVRPRCRRCKFFTFSSFLQNHWGNFNQTWHKTSFGEGDSNFFKWRVLSFFKGRLSWNSKNTSMNLKNLLKNQWVNFSQTWHKVILGKGDSSLLKWMATFISKGR